jgi:hypothetical protein
MHTFSFFPKIEFDRFFGRTGRLPLLKVVIIGTIVKSFRNREKVKSGSVTAFTFDYPPHPAFGVVCVPVPPGYQVNVGVHHGLSGRSTDVDSDVESGNAGIVPPHPFDEASGQLFGVPEFLLVQCQAIGHMPPGNDQQMPGGHREAIVESGHSAALRNGFAFGDPAAEQAIGGLAAAFFRQCGILSSTILIPISAMPSSTGW